MVSRHLHGFDVNSHSDENLSPVNNLQGVILKALTKTWSRDSHGLFDYEATNTKNSILFINGRAKLVRRKNDVRNIAESTVLDLEERELCKTRPDDGKK